MKKTLLVLLVCGVLVGCGDATKIGQLEQENKQLTAELQKYTNPAQPDTPAFKLASLSAGKTIGPDDSAVARAQRLIDQVAARYQEPSDKVVYAATLVHDTMKKSGIDVDPVDFLQSALIFGAADDKQWIPDIAKFSDYYVQVRGGASMTHEQATRALVALQTSLINAAGK